MVGPLISAAASGFLSHTVTKKTEEEKAEKKLDLIKELADLTPEQANAVEAMKKKSVEELEDRITLGIGPFADLPPQASERAREMRAQMQAKMQAKIQGMSADEVQAVAAEVGQLTAEEEQKIAMAENKEQAVKEVVDAKVEKVMKGEMDVLPLQAQGGYAQTY